MEVEVGVGKFGFCTLCDSKQAGDRTEVECFVVATEERWHVILIGAGGLQSESDWSLAAGAREAAVTSPSTRGTRDASVLSGPELSVVGKDGTFSMRVLKVEASAVRAVAQTRNVQLRMEPRPAAQTLMGAFYQSQWASPEQQRSVKPASTDDGGSRRQLEMENRKLMRENERLRRESNTGGAAASSGAAERYQMSENEDGDVGSQSGDDSTDEPRLDAVSQRLREFRKREAGSLGFGRREAQLTPSPERRRQPRDSGRSERVGSPSGRPRRDVTRESGHPRGSRRTRTVESCSVQFQMEAMMLMLEEMREMRKGGRGAGQLDAAENNELDGLRATKVLGRMRALREEMEEKPDANYREYRDHWIHELGAEGKPFRWLDRNKAIRWGKHQSARRFDWMLCHVLETLDKGDSALGRAQLVQCMKCLHEFSGHGSWKASWPYTHMVDPIDRSRHGAMEREVEAVTGYLKTQDDLRARVRKSMGDNVSEEEGADTTGKGASKGGKKKVHV